MGGNHCIYYTIYYNNYYKYHRIFHFTKCQAFFRYRQFKNYASPALGIHLGVRQPGSIKLNDVIYVEAV